jgi:hypothetical protein
MQRRRMLRGVRTLSLRPIISRLAYLQYEYRFQIPCNRSLFRGSANFGFRDEFAVDSPAALVSGAWSANKHVPAILAGAKPPVNSDDGYVTMGVVRTRRLTTSWNAARRGITRQVRSRG